VQKPIGSLRPWQGPIRQHCDGVSGGPREGRPGRARLKSHHRKSCYNSNLRLTGPSGLQIRPFLRDPPDPLGPRCLPGAPRGDQSTQVVDKSAAGVRSGNFPESPEAQEYTTFPVRSGPAVCTGSHPNESDASYPRRARSASPEATAGGIPTASTQTSPCRSDCIEAPCPDDTAACRRP